MPGPSIFVGTAGWTVPRAVAPQFPAEGSGLVRYAHRFLATELNSTFWRRHQAATFARWRDSVPRDFRFAVKLPRTITHVAGLRRARSLLAQFFDDVAGLGDSLGPVLVQLPPSLEFEMRSARAFFRLLRVMHAGHVACEPRHVSWFKPSAEALLVDHGVARVAADPPRTLAGDRPGGFPSLIYFRLHGSPVMYRSSYSPGVLAALAARLRVAAGHGSVWCIFDNTAGGAAADDAIALTHLLAPSPDAMPSDEMSGTSETSETSETSDDGRKTGLYQRRAGS
jgi:uncharacterized protein YecE (DUF72 family)